MTVEGYPPTSEHPNDPGGGNASGEGTVASR